MQYTSRGTRFAGIWKVHVERNGMIYVGVGLNINEAIARALEKFHGTAVLN